MYDVVLKRHVGFDTGRRGQLQETWGRRDRYACEVRRLKPKEYRRLLGG